MDQKSHVYAQAPHEQARLAIASGQNLSVSRTCQIMNISRSGYYAWRGRQVSRQSIANTLLDKQIMYIYAEHQGRYTYRRIGEELRAHCIASSYERVRRRMRMLGIKGIQTRKFKHTTNSKHKQPKMPNLLHQDFTAQAPNEVWVGDITYIRIKQRWLYLPVVIDLYLRQIIGWHFSKRINKQLVLNALKSARFKRGYPKGVIVHIDKGSQYGSNQYQALIKAYKPKVNMSGKGNCYDNAACESFFHTLKEKLVYQQIFQSIEQACNQIFWYIEAYYNRKHRHTTIGFLSPVNFKVAALNLAALLCVKLRADQKVVG